MALLIKLSSAVTATLLKNHQQKVFHRKWLHMLYKPKPKTASCIQVKRYVYQAQTQKSNQNSSYAVGDKINGFIIQEVEHVPEFQMTLIRLHHEATGGEYLHVDRNDSNNAFSVGFRTTPTDSTGLPHILEHTTLCGSKKFPCRDPFFKMLNRSLATFMNAMTSPDSTIYPFSTQNSKDFSNLMSVYLDAVFRPNLRKEDFQQEGWRLEHTNPEDPNTPIIFKGVVFNEMKGVFADGQNIFMQELQSSLLPTNTYGVCSGGEPLQIPKLEHDDLKNFHKRYYSPSNTKYYSYGNFPFERHLKYINEEYLKSLKSDVKQSDSTKVPSEVRWSKPVRKHITCPVDKLAADKDKQSSIAVSYLCCEITDIEESFVLQVIAELLVKGPNCPFYKTLIEPNIGAGYSPATGYEANVRDTFFTVGLQGVTEKDFDRIVKICEETIDEVIEKGFDPKQLEAVLHSIELNTKHQTSDFGLAVLFSISPLWIHDGDIVKSLQVERQVKILRENIQRDKKFLQNKVMRYFKENNHKLILTMSPDQNYEENQKKKEDELLREKLLNLTPADKEQIYKDGLVLLKEKEKEDKSCLPTLRVDDLNRNIERVESIKEKIGGVPFHVFPQPTNGILYFRGILNTDGLSDHLKSLLPLFTMISTRMGTKRKNYKDFDQLASLKTGGLSLGTHLIEDTKRLNRFEESLTISSFCLNRNAESMFELWSELLQEMDFSDVNRFETLVKSQAADLANSITHNGHHYAMLSSASVISASGLEKERFGGMTFVQLMIKAAQSDPTSFLPTLKEIYSKTIQRGRLRCAMNVLDGSEVSMIEKCSKLIENIPGQAPQENPVQGDKKVNPKHRGLFYAFPFPVSFAAKSIVTVPYEHEDFAALRVLTRLMTMKYLHPEIREKGGAYGGGVALSSSGLLNFYSYRDPNALNSLETFDRSRDWLKKGEFAAEDVDEAKLGVFQNVDSPVSPGSKGMRSFLHGVSDDILQQHREKLMAVTKEDLLNLADKYLDESKDKSLVGRCVIGPDNKVITDNASQEWTVIRET